MLNAEQLTQLYPTWNTQALRIAARECPKDLPCKAVVIGRRTYFMEGENDMSITEIRESKADMLTAQEVAKVLGCNPQSIRNAAQTEEGRKQLGFPVIVVGTRVRIPRIPFLSFIAA